MRRKIQLPLLIFFWMTVSGCSNKINESNIAELEDQATLVRGGLMVYESNGHGLIVATADLGKHNWEEAIKTCDELELNGFNDWRLPTKEELDTLYSIFKVQGKGGFDDGSYWSSTEYNSYYAWRKNFKTGKVDRRGNKSKEQGVRAVRDF
jgi:hypothetical protein